MLLKNYQWLILIILIMALVFRFIGIFYAYPLSLGSDEMPTLNAGLKMIGTQSLIINAKGYYYPPLLAYIYLPFLAIFILLGFFNDLFIDLIQLKKIVLLSPGVFIPLARFISVIFGTATVYLSYKICQQLFYNKKISILAALLLAVNFFHVIVSHFANSWTIQTFFILLVLFWSINYFQKSENKIFDFIIGGILIGVAFGINFIGIISYFWLILAYYLKNKNQGGIKIFLKRNFILTNVIILLIVGICYFLNPFGLNNYFNRLADINSGNEAFSNAAFTGFFSLTTLTILIYYLKNIFFIEPVILIFSVFSGYALWKSQRTAFYFLVPWVIIYFLSISSLTSPNIRYLLPVIPFLIMIVAFYLNYLSENISKKYISPILLAILIVYSLMFVVLFDLRMTRPDTRLLARNWVINNIPSGATIKNEQLGESLSLIESSENLQFLQKYFPEMMSTKRYYLLSLDQKNYPQPNYFININNYENRVPVKIKNDYLVLSNFNKDEFINISAKIPDNYQLIKSFIPNGGKNENKINFSELNLPFENSYFNPWSLFKSSDSYGPYIYIYKLSSNNLDVN